MSTTVLVSAAAVSVKDIVADHDAGFPIDDAVKDGMQSLPCPKQGLCL